MYQHVVEAFVSVPHSKHVAERICSQIRDFYRSIIVDGSDKLLEFDNGRATIRLTDNGLFLRVSAGDLVIFYGIRTLLEGSLSALSRTSEGAFEWFPADGIPFRGIEKRIPSDERGDMRCP